MPHHVWTFVTRYAECASGLVSCQSGAQGRYEIGMQVVLVRDIHPFRVPARGPEPSPSSAFAGGERGRRRRREDQDCRRREAVTPAVSRWVNGVQRNVEAQIHPRPPVSGSRTPPRRGSPHPSVSPTGTRGPAPGMQQQDARSCQVAVRLPARRAGPERPRGGEGSPPAETRQGEPAPGQLRRSCPRGESGIGLRPRSSSVSGRWTGARRSSNRSTRTPSSRWLLVSHTCS